MHLAVQTPINERLAKQGYRLTMSACKRAFPSRHVTDRPNLVDCPSCQAVVAQLGLQEGSIASTKLLELASSIRPPIELINLMSAPGLLNEDAEFLDILFSDLPNEVTRALCFILIRTIFRIDAVQPPEPEPEPEIVRPTLPPGWVWEDNGTGVSAARLDGAFAKPDAVGMPASPQPVPRIAEAEDPHEAVLQNIAFVEALIPLPMVKPGPTELGRATVDAQPVSMTKGRLVEPGHTMADLRQGEGWGSADIQPISVEELKKTFGQHVLDQNPNIWTTLIDETPILDGEAEETKPQLQIWTPKTGGPRKVLSRTEETVTYCSINKDGKPGKERSVKASTFDRWIKRTSAALPQSAEE